MKSCDCPEQRAANSEDRIVADALAVNRRPGMFRLQTFPGHKGIRVYFVILGFNVMPMFSSVSTTMRKRCS